MSTMLINELCDSEGFSRVLAELRTTNSQNLADQCPQGCLKVLTRPRKEMSQVLHVLMAMRDTITVETTISVVLANQPSWSWRNCTTQQTGRMTAGFDH